MSRGKPVMGDARVNGGRKLSLSRAIRTGANVSLTVRMQDRPMKASRIEDQIRALPGRITAWLAMAARAPGDMVKGTAGLHQRAGFRGFNAVRDGRFPDASLARPAKISDLLVGVKGVPRGPVSAGPRE